MRRPMRRPGTRSTRPPSREISIIPSDPKRLEGRCSAAQPPEAKGVWRRTGLSSDSKTHQNKIPPASHRPRWCLPMRSKQDAELT